MHELYDWFGVNVALFHLINSLHAVWWDNLMLAMTWLGDHNRYPFYLAIALATAYARPRTFPLRNVLVLAIGNALTGMLIPLLKPAVDFPRPLLALGHDVVVVVGEPELHHSFPSGHATFVVLLAAALGYGMPRPTKWALWLFALFVCLSRVAVGAHFPADVVGGALVGLLAFAIALVATHLLGDRDQTRGRARL